MNLFDNKRTFSIVVKAIQESSTEVSLNKTWENINQELGVGNIINNKLILSAQDRNILKRIFLNETGVDPTTIDINFFKTASRIQTTNNMIHEKWAGQKVKEGIIYIRSLTDTVELDKEYQMPKNSYLAVSWQQAKNHKHDTFIVIENQEAFLVAEQIKWPKEILNSNPLLIYRGDPEVTPAAVKKFIEDSSKTFMVFFDYDPAGLMMALTLPRMPSILIPNLPEKELKSHTKKQAFNEQINAKAYLKKVDVSHIYYDKISSLMINRLAITQERMISKEMSLIVL